MMLCHVVSLIYLNFQICLMVRLLKGYLHYMVLVSGLLRCFLFFQCKDQTLLAGETLLLGGECVIYMGTKSLIGLNSKSIRNDILLMARWLRCTFGRYPWRNKT